MTDKVLLWRCPNCRKWIDTHPICNVCNYELPSVVEHISIDKTDVSKYYHKGNEWPPQGRRGIMIDLKGDLTMTDSENTGLGGIKPKVDLESFEIPEDQEIAVEDMSGGALKIAFIGAGQCGSRIAEEFFKLGYKKCIVVNTAEQDLENIEVDHKMLIKKSGKTGGAGKDMTVAMDAIEASKAEVYNKMVGVFGDNVDHVFVCAGLGGGTGGGSIGHLINLSKQYMEYIGCDDPNKAVGVIVTLPTRGEAGSPIVKKNAFEASKQLSGLADKNEISPMIVIDNDKIQRLYRGKLSLDNFHSTINSSVAQMLHLFNYISLQPSDYTPVDPTDLRSVIESGGHMILGVTSIKDVSEPTCVSDALKKNLTKTLLADDFDLSTASAAGMIVIGGDAAFAKDGLRDAVELGFDTMTSFTGGAKVHRGVYKDSGRSTLGVYTMISGLKRPEKRYGKLK
jgi:cell division GTPase FtsZ